MGSSLDKLRCPSRMGAASLISLSYTVVTPFVVQPIIAVATVLLSSNITYTVATIILIQVAFATYVAKRRASSTFLYYWTLSSIIYSIILFESSVIPLLEIRWDENCLVLLLVAGTLTSFYIAKDHSSRTISSEQVNGTFSESICPICRIKIYPRCFHCPVCQTCIVRYDYHSYWLDSCVGEHNQLPFMLGLLCAAIALAYGSLLTLTTVCRPEYKMGVLMPSDCSDVADDLEAGVCYMSAVYCLGLSVAVLFQLCHHVWLVSRGLSGEEWRLQGYRPWATSPYSRGFASNWLHLYRGLKLRR